jgi:hypothetical protein
MESETVFADGERPMATESPREADRHALAGVRRWLEDAWRHGEIVVDDNALETHEPTRPSNRFDVSHREDEAPEPNIN